MTPTAKLIAQFFGLSRPIIARVEGLQSEHAEALAIIHENSFSHGWSETEFERLLSDRTIICDGLFIGTEASPCGFVISRYILDEAEILSLAIEQAQRQCGLSYQLLTRHRETLIHAGVRVLHLEVDKNNVPALALYRRAGFVVTGERHSYYTQSDGSRTTALTMSLTL